MACNKLKFPGKDVVLEYHISCADEFPLETDWKRFGSLRTKEFEVAWDTDDASDADSPGSLRENIATFQTLTISGDGTVKVAGGGAENLKILTKHVVRPDATGGQPVVWLRMTFPDLTFIAYCLVSSISRSAPHDGTVTYSFEASATASDYGLIVEDTPQPDAPDPVEIQVVPNSATLQIGQSVDAQGVVMPAGAAQTIRWTSSNPSIASVDMFTGKITAIAGGTVTITAASAVDGGVTNTLSVTVQPQVSGISVSPTSVAVDQGDTAQITATVIPAGAAPGLTYTSDAPSVATVDNAGLVTAVAVGTANVTIRSQARPGVSVVVPVVVSP